MDGEQRDSKNTTKNLFVGLAAANEKKASNPSGECDNQPNNNNGKRRRVSFGRRITYFQPPSSTSGSSSSYVRMVSPAPTPSPLPPDLFEDTHAIFDHFQQRAPDATRTLREDSTIELHKSAQSDDDINAVSLPSEVLTLSLTQNDLQSGQQRKDPIENAFDSSLDSADEDEVIVRMEEDSTDEDEYAVKEAEEEEMNNISVQMDLTGEVLASIKEAEENNSNQIVSQMEESQPQETTEIIDTSPIPEEVICQIEDDYFEALHEYVEKTKLFYKLQDEKLQLLDQMQERTRTMREENQAFWANLENGIVEVLREVANARRRGPQ